MSIQSAWQRIPEKWRVEIVSASHTIVAAMAVELGIQLNQSQDLIANGQWTKTVGIAIAAAVVRSGWKAVIAILAGGLQGQGQKPPTA